MENLKLSYKICSVGVYFLSAIVPIFFGSNTIGIFGLILGWMGVFAMELFIGLPWIANILYFINLALPSNKKRIRIYLSIITIFFGLFLIGVREIPVDEGGGSEKVIVGIGFGIWMSSFVLILIDRLKKL